MVWGFFGLFFRVFVVWFWYFQRQFYAEPLSTTVQTTGFLLPHLLLILSLCPPLLPEAIGSRNHSEWGRMLLLGPPQCNTCISPSAASWFPTPCFPLNPPAAQSLTSGTRCAVYACFPRLSYSHSPSADLTLCRQPRLRCPLSASI